MILRSHVGRDASLHRPFRCAGAVRRLRPSIDHANRMRRRLREVACTRPNRQRRGSFPARGHGRPSRGWREACCRPWLLRLDGRAVAVGGGCDADGDQGESGNGDQSYGHAGFLLLHAILLGLEKTDCKERRFLIKVLEAFKI